MNKLRHIQTPLLKLLFTAGYLALILLLWALGAKCIFLTFLHIPCPGCGMTRAMLSAFRLDFPAAFQYHGMFWSMPILYLYFLFDGKLFQNRIINKSVFISIVIGFLLVWGIKIVECFA